MRSDSRSLTSFSLRNRYDWMTVPTRLACPGLAMQAAHEVERALGVRRAFHVDAHEVVDADGVVDQLGDQAEGELLADVETHVRELEADVGVELALVDLVEHAMVELGAVLGFVGVGDVLAQVVDADAGAPLVDHLRGANHIVQVRARDEALREAQTERRFLGEVAQAAAFRERNEGRP